jgi:hypothetical protein
MKRLTILTSIGLGLGLTLGLLWLLGGGFPVVSAQGPDTYSTYYVALDGSCGGMDPCYTTVQAAVDAADDPNDVIKVAAGTYTDVQGHPAPVGYPGPSVITQVVYISKTVTVQGGYTTANWTVPDPVANPTILDAEGEGRVLCVVGSVSPVIQGLRFTGGDAAGLEGATDGSGDPIAGGAGGAVYIRTAAATISDTQVFSNAAVWGGGLYVDYGTVKLSDSSILSNTTTQNGGGLAFMHSNAMLNGNDLTHNESGADGGGLYMSESDATLRGNTVFSNTANRGGGIVVWYSDATLDGDTISSNAAANAGGMYLTSSRATIRGNTVISNVAADQGGGILMYDDVTLVDSTVSANIAERGGGVYGSGRLEGNSFSNNLASYGGGLFLFGDHTLVNNVVVDNQAETTASGLYIEGGSLQFLHTTIARNTGGDGRGIYLTDDPYGTSSTVAMTNTILVSHTLGIYVESGSTAQMEATLDALGQGRVLYISNVSWTPLAGLPITPTIEGLRITGGDALRLQGGIDDLDAGGGVYVVGAAAILQDNQVFDNTTRGYGGGLYLQRSAATVGDNDIFSNTAPSGWGGGMYLNLCDARLTGNTISTNTAGYGGGVYLRESAATLTNNTLCANAAGSGGRLYANGGPVTISETLIFSNVATYDGGGLVMGGELLRSLAMLFTTTPLAAEVVDCG